MNIGIIGATGLVGRKMLQVIEEQKLEFDNLFIASSKESIGKRIQFNNKLIEVISVENVLNKQPNIVLFSAGASVSKEWAPKFAKKGCFVIDNSSAWRMDKLVPLVVPEINPQTITKKTKIIANPNCSTIQLVMALYPLHVAFKIKRVVISTYQSVTGTGNNAVNQLFYERKGENVQKVYPYQIDLNCIPQCDIFSDEGYTKEELKLINETRKIFDDESIKITSTAIRVPVIGGHSESINVEFEKKFSIQDIYRIFESTKGIIIMDNTEKNIYPMPIISEDRDEVFVGRIRKDFSIANGLNLWVVADNLRKGAATNTVQIADYIIKNYLI